jgi:hypothetical protein
MSKCLIAVLLLGMMVSADGEAQSLSLPSVDGITAFYRTARLSSRNELESSAAAPCSKGASTFTMCGWGFETVYELTKPKQGVLWGAELAVGYDFLNLEGTVREDSSYEVRGSVQTLPSITLYISRDLTDSWSAYGGLGTGLVTLKNVRAYDSEGRIYAITGDTWGLTTTAGLTYSVRERDDGGPGVSVFIESAYEIRNFPSIGYTLPSEVKTLPAALPRSLTVSGLVINFGLEIGFRKKAEPAPAK